MEGHTNERATADERLVAGGEVPDGRRADADAEVESGPALYDLPVFGWAWQGDARDVERP